MPDEQNDRGYLMGQSWITDVETTIWGDPHNTASHPTGSLFWLIRPARIKTNWEKDTKAEIPGISVYRAKATLIFNGQEAPEEAEQEIFVVHCFPTPGNVETEGEVQLPDQTGQTVMAIYRGQWEIFEMGGHLTGKIVTTQAQVQQRNSRFEVYVPPRPLVRNGHVDFNSPGGVTYAALAPLLPPGEQFTAGQIVSISKNQTIYEWEVIAAECPTV